jgi:hypothetical protein
VPYIATMENLLNLVKSSFKVTNVSITNTVFQLHSKWTVGFLLLASSIVACKQLFGDPIICTSQVQNSIPAYFIDAHCWLANTAAVTVVNTLVTQSIPGRFQKYYKFVWLGLIVQGGLCYMPFYVWQNIDAGKVKSLVMDTYLPIVDLDQKNLKIKALVNYFTSISPKNNYLALKFTLCEVWNLFNVIIQMVAVNWFLG